MKLRSALISTGLLLLAVVLGLARSTERPSAVELGRLQEGNWQELAPEGKEVDAIYGDLVLRNEHLSAVIAQPLATRHANMTVRDVAGTLLDLTVRDGQSDQLSALYPGRRAFPFRSWSATVDGEAVAVDELSSTSGKQATITVLAAAGEGRPQVEVSWSLAEGARHLTMTTRYTNTSDEPLTVALKDDMRADGGNEDMVRSPNGEVPLVWVHDRFWNQAWGIEAIGVPVRTNSNSRVVDLEYGAGSVTLEPGKSTELVRRVIPGRNLLDVLAEYDRLHGRAVHPVEIAVTGGNGSPVPEARVDVLQGETLRGSARTDRHGNLVTSLPEGEFRLKVTAMGVVLSDKLQSVAVAEGANSVDLQLANWKPGSVAARITNADGTPLPCKVEFTARPGTGTPQPNFGPVTAEFAVGNLRYAPHGEFTQPLPPGRYDVVISHGPEFDSVTTELTVPPGKNVPLVVSLRRSVDTTGWISSDFHSHSSPSGDNTGSQLGRVLNLVCEHIEFAPCTEHNRVSSYVPHIRSLGIEKLLATETGMELTGRPLPLNHQNAFPIKYTPHTQDGGGPVTDGDPEEQMERLALWDDRSDKLVQQNHPDLGWLFYDRDGDGQPDNGHSRSFALMDVIEIHPVQNALRLEPFETLPGRKGNNRIFNWLQLLNQGFRIPGVVNTDAHYNFHGSGWLRNWFRSPTDDPAEIRTMDVVHAAERGNSILSNGPFLEVSLKETGGEKTITAGDDLELPSGSAKLSIRVQCPNWLDIDHVFVLVNGRRHAMHDYTRADHPDRFRDGVVRFEQTLPLELKSDAHIIVVAGGEKTVVGPVMGPRWGPMQPAALSNPMFLDVDGDGFQHNRDTLDAPLPVKFGTR